MDTGLGPRQSLRTRADALTVADARPVRTSEPAPTVLRLVPPDRPKLLRRRYWRKRLFDFVVALLASVMFAPVVLLAWIAVRVTSRGPGLYWSVRAGRNGRSFLMPKFRTMAQDAPQQPRELLQNADEHVTWLGKIMRRWSLDELPQLYCILKGEMSFIGPRPLLPNDPAQVARAQFPDALSVRPGLSGLSQVRGRNRVSPRRKARLDAFYARARTGPFDLEICMRTIGVLVTGRGIM